MLLEVVRNTQLKFRYKILHYIRQWFLVLAENHLRPLYYSTWYIFNFGQIFPSSQTHTNVTRSSEEYSAKVSVNDLAVCSVASSF